ncbi:hypothetical protein GGI20_004987 [Coemansia sp. BCRC 34301]|nr:hypothetical protein GGI20_004987 [Coemansia sp. BCRC 34301]
MSSLAMAYLTPASQAHTTSAYHSALMPLPDCTPIDMALLQDIINWQAKDDVSELAYLFDATLLDLPPMSPVAMPASIDMVHTVSPTELQPQFAELPLDLYSAEPPHNTAGNNNRRRPSCIAILRRRRNAVFLPRVVTDAILDHVASSLTVSNVANCQQQADPQPRMKLEAGIPKLDSHAADKRCPKGYSTQVNNILDEWAARNRANPYPTPQDKLRLMSETGLTKMQLKNWLCNIRRRKLPGTIRRPKKSTRAYHR